MRYWYSNQEIYTEMNLCIPDKFFKFEIPKYKQIIQQKLKLSENHPFTCYVHKFYEIKTNNYLKHIFYMQTEGLRIYNIFINQNV